MRSFFSVVGINVVGIVLAIAVGEGVARLVVPAQKTSIVPGQESPAVPSSVSADELGWVPEPNAVVHTVDREFSTVTVTNALGLYDFAPPADRDGRRLSLLALGDSHTAAMGVSTGETWPKVLQRELEEAGVANWVHNGAVHGYSLDQYLVRFRQLAPSLKPRIVLIGFSMATDFYDLGITSSGDFIYGDVGRVYFALDGDKGLVEHRELIGTTLNQGALPVGGYSLRGVRGLLEHSALFRLAKRSQLAMWVAVRWRVDNESLWPGLDTGLKVALSPDDERRIDLAGELIGRIAAEARQAGAIPVLVHIPYLAQVYDSLWEQSFGSLPGYDRELPSIRLAAFAARHRLLFADAYPAMRRHVAASGEWLHYRIDGHPNAVGQRLIGNTVFKTLEKCLERNPELAPDVCH